MATTSKSSKTSKASKKANRRSSTKAAAKAASAKFGSKSDFVRSNPNLSAPEIVELAQKQGIALTTSHIYNIRATDKKKRGGGEAATPVRSVAASTTSSSDADSQLRALFLRVGTDRVEQLLNEFRSSTPMFAMSPAQVQRPTRRRVAPVQQSTPRPASVPPPASQEATHAS